MTNRVKLIPHISTATVLEKFKFQLRAPAIKAILVKKMLQKITCHRSLVAALPLPRCSARLDPTHCDRTNRVHTTLLEITNYPHQYQALFNFWYNDYNFPCQWSWAAVDSMHVMWTDSPQHISDWGRNFLSLVIAMIHLPFNGYVLTHTNTCMYLHVHVHVHVCNTSCTVPVGLISVQCQKVRWYWVSSYVEQLLGFMCQWLSIQCRYTMSCVHMLCITSQDLIVYQCPLWGMHQHIVGSRVGPGSNLMAILLWLSNENDNWVILTRSAWLPLQYCTLLLF